MSASDEAWPIRSLSTASRQRRSSAPPAGETAATSASAVNAAAPRAVCKPSGSAASTAGASDTGAVDTGDGRLGRRRRGGVGRGFEAETFRGHTGRHRVLPRGRGRRFTVRRVGRSGSLEQVGLRVAPRILDEPDG